MRINIAKVFTLAVIFTAALVFAAMVGGPNILKGYIETGIGGCSKIPILCKSPVQEIAVAEAEKEYTGTFIPYKFSKMSLSAPRGFAVVQELEKKTYYKKRLSRKKESVIYAFRQGPEYFIKLFPQVKSEGITDNYAFIKRLAFARTDRIKNLTDAFFVILKSILTPDIGNQHKAVMASFSMPGKKGFISYNLFDAEYYFDCNLVNENGDFFKLYIKDLGARLKLDEVLAIISTLKRED
ncbi:MAG: hypothetical protein PHS12_04530 [Candidatus Omnitrophica bacterium]|nr:hypothetical protein [Candidatus Omnitrophota bacterium]